GFCNRMTPESTRTGCLCWPMRRDGCRVAAYALPGLRFGYLAGRVSAAPPAHGVLQPDDLGIHPDRMFVLADAA
ncbi:TPA: hypothetical protein ACHOZD_004185, partial [Raoultella ornithinolytica]